MPKMTEYPKVTTLVPDNIFIVDGPDGTKGITAENLTTAIVDGSSGGLRVLPERFTINSAAWVASTTYDDYPFQATISISGLTSGDLVRADFDLDSLIASDDSEIAPAGTTSTGAAIFYAKKAPTINLSGMYTVFKGV